MELLLHGKATVVLVLNLFIVYVLAFLLSKNGTILLLEPAPTDSSKSIDEVMEFRGLAIGFYINAVGIY